MTAGKSARKSGSGSTGAPMRRTIAKLSLILRAAVNCWLFRTCRKRPLSLLAPHVQNFHINSSFGYPTCLRVGPGTNGTVIVIATEAHCAMLKESVQHVNQGKLILANAVELLLQFI